jgi:predicted PurR-regulated permease PerM
MTAEPTSADRIPADRIPADPIPADPIPADPIPARRTPGRRSPWAEVPFRSILATVAILLSTYAALQVIQRITRIITWVLIALFFAVVLRPVVDLLQRRLRMPKGAATAVVLIVAISLLSLMSYVFIRPVAEQGTEFVDNFQTYVQDAQDGKGTVGELVQRYDVENWIERNQERIREEITQLGNSAVSIVQSAFNTVIAALTILVLTILFILEGGTFFQAALRFFPDERRARLERVAEQSAKAVTGYVAGNLMISLIAGLSTWVFLVIVGVPFAHVLALWVAFADLIPLVGATLGAIPTVLVAFLSSTPAGIATLIFYVLYQQFENHVLQVAIMSRTVALKPLSVLLSVLIGVELFGLLGALLAIPAAGVIKVVGTELLVSRRPDLVPVAEPRPPRRLRLRRQAPTD